MIYTTNMTDFDFNNISNVNEYLDTKLYKLLGKPKTISIKSILVLSGGGIKGLAHIGGLKAMKELHLLKHIKTIVGTSIGALFGYLHTIGYTPEELYEFIMTFDLKKLKSLDPAGFFNDFGLDNGDRFIMVLSKMTETKGFNKNITFKELFKKTGLTLIVSASCMNDKQAYYFSHKNNPDMSVILAVRMSTAFPIYFMPVLYDGKMFLDGGCIDNYPVQLFYDNINAVIGFYLTETREYIKDIKNAEEFLINLVQCLFEGVTCNSVKGFEKITVAIKIPNINALDLDLTDLKKSEIYSHGYNAVIKWFSENNTFVTR
jgi:NTE family protein